MTAEAARLMVEQVMARYATIVTLAMREDIVRLVLHVERETLRAVSEEEKKEANA